MTIPSTDLRTQCYIERKILQCLIRYSDAELKELSALLKKSKNQHQYSSNEGTELMNEYLVVLFKEGIHAFQTELIEHILYRLIDKIENTPLPRVEDPHRYLGMLKDMEVNLKITVVDPLTQKLRATVSLAEGKEKVKPKLIPFNTILPVHTVHTPLSS